MFKTWVVEELLLERVTINVCDNHTTKPHSPFYSHTHTKWEMSSHKSEIPLIQSKDEVMKKIKRKVNSLIGVLDDQGKYQVRIHKRNESVDTK